MYFWVVFWLIVIIEIEPTITAMITSLFSQKNVCAALGLMMAITIVWKAKVETNLIQHTARIEFSDSTYTRDMTSDSEAINAYMFKKIRTENSVL